MVAMTCGSTRVHAQVVDITTPNGQGFSASDYSAVTSSDNGANSNSETNPDPRPGIFELGYVHYNCVPDKVWDMEAFGYDQTSNTLTYIGGFNPLTQVHADGQNWSLGDIFI